MILNPFGAVEIVADEDGWTFAVGARFVGPDEWIANRPGPGHYWFSRGVLLDAFAAAADDAGLLLDFQVNRFYERQVTEVVRVEDDPKNWRLKYDRFTAMVLMDATTEFVEAGLLAHRGNGGSYDYRLALPAASRG